jgi:hypothetical protein
MRRIFDVLRRDRQQARTSYAVALTIESGEMAQHSYPLEIPASLRHDKPNVITLTGEDESWAA